MKKSILLIILALAVVGAAITLFACNHDKDPSLTDEYYVNRSSVGEFKVAKLESALPKGYKFCYGYNGDTSVSRYTEYGYIKEIDCFVVSAKATKSEYAKLNLVKRDTNDLFFNNISFEIVQMQVYYGNVFMMTDDSKIVVYDFENQKWLYGNDNPLYIAAAQTKSIATYVYPVSKNYFVTTASAKTYNSQFGTSLETVSGSKFFAFSSNGNMVGRVEVTTSKISDVEGFDDYVVVKNATGSSGKETRIISLSGLTQKSDALIAPSPSGVFEYASGSANGCETTYFGKSNFLIHIEESGSEDDYFYKDEDSKYWKVSRFLYNAASGKRKTYKSDLMFLSIENEFYKYSSSKTFNTENFIKSGYSYVGFGMERKSDKTVIYDRYLIKNNVSFEDEWEFGIVTSLRKTAAYLYESSEGVTTDKIKSLSVNELVRTYVDNVGVVQISTGVVNIYDNYGKLIGRSDKYEYQSATYNSGVIICSILDKGSSSSTASFLYGALDKNGDVVVPFEYTSLTMFTGYYAIGEKTDENGVHGYYLVGQNGYSILLGNKNVITDDYNFHIKSNGNAIYKTGAYVYFDYDEEGKKIFGVKSTNISNNKNVLLEAKYSEITLFAPSGEYGVVYAIAKLNDDSNYEVYRLK